MNKKFQLTINTFLFLSLGLLLTSQISLKANTDIEVPNAGFEDAGPTTSDGGNALPLQWQFAKWKGSADETVPSGLSTDTHYEGKQSAFVGAVKNGAAGWTSKTLAIASTLDELHFSVRVKKSDDYAGNIPWVFITWFKSDGTFINKTDAKLTPPFASGEWNEVTLDVKASDIPDGSDHFQINLTTQHLDKAGDNVSGQVNFDNVQLSMTEK